jgi:cytoskeletal protein RodZ
MPTEEKENNFAAAFSARLKERGFTVKKLAEISGISPEHLENLSRGAFDRLPPAPYLRGYMEKLAPLLDFNATEWWNALEEAAGIKESGADDRLPRNRFAPRPIARYVWGIIVGVIVIVYFALRLPTILGRPGLVVAEPATDMAVANDRYTVRGTVTNADQVFVSNGEGNGEAVPIVNGAWEKKDVLLNQNLNTIVVTAKKFLGGEVRVVRQVTYTAPTSATTTSAAPATSGTTATSTPQ